MPLSDVYRKDITEIYEGLQAVASQESDWEDDLINALKNRDFSDLQVEAIKKASSNTLFIEEDEETQAILYFEEDIAHAFIDPINKGSLPLEPSILDYQDDEIILTELIKRRQALDDIVHNYPLLVPKDSMPSIVGQIIHYYEDEMIPHMDRLIDTLGDETCIDINEIEIKMVGVDCLSKLPENLFIEPTTDTELHPYI